MEGIKVDLIVRCSMGVGVQKRAVRGPIVLPAPHHEHARPGESAEPLYFSVVKRMCLTNRVRVASHLLDFGQVRI